MFPLVLARQDLQSAQPGKGQIHEHKDSREYRRYSPLHDLRKQQSNDPKVAARRTNLFSTSLARSLSGATHV